MDPWQEPWLGGELEESVLGWVAILNILSDIFLDNMVRM